MSTKVDSTVQTALLVVNVDERIRGQASPRRCRQRESIIILCDRAEGINA
jgi:hypothetical protein